MNDIVSKFVSWYYDNLWTPHGEVFDIGNTTSEAICRLKQGNINPIKAGASDEYRNGNRFIERTGF